MKFWGRSQQELKVENARDQKRGKDFTKGVTFYQLSRISPGEKRLRGKIMRIKVRRVRNVRVF